VNWDEQIIDVEKNDLIRGYSFIRPYALWGQGTITGDCGGVIDFFRRISRSGKLSDFISVSSINLTFKTSGTVSEVLKRGLFRKTLFQTISRLTGDEKVTDQSIEEGFCLVLKEEIKGKLVNVQNLETHIIEMCKAVVKEKARHC